MNEELKNKNVQLQRLYEEYSYAYHNDADDEVGKYSEGEHEDGKETIDSAGEFFKVLNEMMEKTVKKRKHAIAKEKTMKRRHDKLKIMNSSLVKKLKFKKAQLTLTSHGTLAFSDRCSSKSGFAYYYY